LTISGSVLFIDTQHNLAADRIQRPSEENKIKRCFYSTQTTGSVASRLKTWMV